MGRCNRQSSSVIPEKILRPNLSTSSKSGLNSQVLAREWCTTCEAKPWPPIPRPHFHTYERFTDKVWLAFSWPGYWWAVLERSVYTHLSRDLFEEVASGLDEVECRSRLAGSFHLWTKLSGQN